MTTDYYSILRSTPRYGADRLIEAVVAVAKINAAGTPVVGEGANIHGWSDVYAHTVVRVSDSGDTAWIQRDRATLLNGATSGESDALVMTPGGFCAHTEGRQRYSYERNPDAPLVRVTRRKSGKWRTSGGRSRGQIVTFGERSEHYDFNF